MHQHMSIPTTIDNFDPKWHRQYEKNRDLLEENYYEQDHRGVVKSAMHDTFGESGNMPGEYESQHNATPWGIFEQPEGRPRQTLLKNNQMGESFGPSERFENQIGNLNAREEQELIRYRNQNPNPTPSNLKSQQKISEDGKKIKTVLQFMDESNTLLAQANAERFRYNKG